MRFIDTAIPLAVGLLLIIRPAAFLKKSAPPELVAKRTVTLRKIGYLLLAVAAIDALVVLARP